jgi:predicted small integral membrane protein
MVTESPIVTATPTVSPDSGLMKVATTPVERAIVTATPTVSPDSGLMKVATTPVERAIRRLGEGEIETAFKQRKMLR